MSDTHPLARLTGGGWLKGVLRLALGLGVVVAVLWYAGEEAYAPLLEPAVIPYVVAGAAVHLVQRIARVLKWAAMIADTGLVTRSRRFLIRIQLIGLIANLLLPVSDAMKIWAVCDGRKDVVPATRSIAADIAIHSLMVAGVGALACAWVGASLGGWAATGGIALLATLAVVVVVVWQRRAGDRRLAWWDRRVLGWCALETACQLGTYAIAMAAVGPDVPLARLMSVSPALFVSDVMMITPSGLGIREAVFAIAFDALEGYDTSASVAVGLATSSMLLLASLVGGGLALLLPDER